VPIERAGEICVIFARGADGKLSGRYFHVQEDDVTVLIERADEVIDKDTQALRLRRLVE